MNFAYALESRTAPVLEPDASINGSASKRLCSATFANPLRQNTKKIQTTPKQTKKNQTAPQIREPLHVRCRLSLCRAHWPDTTATTETSTIFATVAFQYHHLDLLWTSVVASDTGLLWLHKQGVPNQFKHRAVTSRRSGHHYAPPLSRIGQLLPCGFMSLGSKGENLE